MQKEKFDWACFLPSKFLTIKVVLITLMIFSLNYLNVFEFLGKFTYIFKEIIHYGLFIFMLVYLTYFEINIYNPVRDYIKDLRIWVKNTIEKYDSKLDTFMFQDINEQVSCLSRVLQYLLTLVKIPELSVRKVTVKKVGVSILYVPVFIFIVFWDIFFKGIVPYVYDLLVIGLKKIFIFFRFNLLINYIKKTNVYDLISFAIEEYKLESLLFVFVFVLLFATMEILGIISITLFTEGKFTFGVYAYLTKFGIFFPIHDMHHKKANKMREIRWYEIRENGIIRTFEWIEMLNAYMRVMNLLMRIKAFIKTIYLQLSKLLSAIKLIVGNYIRNSMNYIFVFFGLDSIESSDSNLWQDIKFIYGYLKKKLFSKFLSYLYPNKYLLYANLKSNFEIAERRLDNAISKNRSNKHIGGHRARVTITKRALDNFIVENTIFKILEDKNIKTSDNYDKKKHQYIKLDLIFNEILKKKRNEGN